MIQNKLSNDLTIADNLKSIIGFGPYLSNKFCFKLGINPKTKLSALSSKKKEAFIRLMTELSQNVKEAPYKERWDRNNGVPEFLIDTNLLDARKAARKKQIDLNTIRGSLLNKGLPCRGQRTKTNASTAKKRKGY